MNYDAIWEKTKDLPWCVLVTTGRTGTDFFQSLLDSHPEVFVFNGKLFFHPFWNSSECVASKETVYLSDLLDKFIGHFIKSLKSRYDPMERKDKLGDGHDQSIDIDPVEFKEHVTGIVGDRPVTAKNVMIAVYVAYDLCLGIDIARKKLFLHHLHHVRKVDEFMADIPDAKIICMTRDPRALYVSGVENWRRINPATDNPAYPLYILWRAVEEASGLRAYNDGRLRLLKLEDLAHEKTLRAVCDWLGVSFDPCMTEATWAGMRWWGDMVSKNKIPENEHGFSKTMVANKWEQKLDALDKTRLNYLLGDVLEWYGYPQSRREGPVAAVLMALAMVLPTGYERRYLSPVYLLKALFTGNVRKFAAAFYHPLRRILWFYKLFYRRCFGKFFLPPYIGDEKTPIGN